MEKIQKEISEQFREAVNHLDHKKLKELLPISKDYINTRFYFHWSQEGYGDKITPLMYVCGMFTADSYSRNHYGWYGPAGLCFDLLMQYGADPNIACNGGYTPIFCLIHELDVDFGDIISNFNILEKLVSAGADINFMSIKKKSTYKTEETPLIATLRRCSEFNEATANTLIKIINYLIPRGLNLNLRDNNGYTALHYASKLSNKRLLLCLLQAGADY